MNDTQKILKVIGYEKPNLALIKSISTQAKILFTQSEENVNKNHLVRCIKSVMIEKRSLSLNLHPVKLAEQFNLDPIRHDEYKFREPIHWQLNSTGQTLVLKNHSNPINNSISSLALKKAVIKAMEWNEGLMNVSINSLREIEEQENLNGSYVRRTLQLAYLPPTILEAIISRSAANPKMNLESLRTTISLDWN